MKKNITEKMRDLFSKTGTQGILFSEICEMHPNYKPAHIYDALRTMKNDRQELYYINENGRSVWYKVAPQEQAIKDFTREIPAPEGWEERLKKQRLSCLM